MEVGASPAGKVSADSPGAVPGRSPAPSTGSCIPAKKRRRMLSSCTSDSADEVARDMYSQFAAEVPSDEGGIGPHQHLARCGDNSAVTDVIELLHLLKSQDSNVA